MPLDRPPSRQQEQPPPPQQQEQQPPQPDEYIHRQGEDAKYAEGGHEAPSGVGEISDWDPQALIDEGEEPQQQQQQQAPPQPPRPLQQGGHVEVAMPQRMAADGMLAVQIHTESPPAGSDSPSAVYF